MPGAPRRIAAALLSLAAAVIAPAENLLANPGFEELAADKPVRWDVFVQPKPGAAARVSDEAHGGAYAVWLHTPDPYEKESLNNWSQNIIADLGGQTLRVSGYIRVEDAEEAALLVQCWRKRPWGVLGANSTSIETPVYGTQDWQEVSMEVEVPKGTDFITIRCALLGTGSAWFDDISVVPAGEKDDQSQAGAPVPEKPAESSTPADVESRPARSAESAETTAAAPAASPTPVASPSREAVEPMVNKLESEVERLRQANSILTDTLEEIQHTNRELLGEMLAIQEELRALKAEKEAAAAPALDPSKPRVPPLVPLNDAAQYGAP